MSDPPKQILVVIGSGIGWCSMCRPSGEITVMPPLTSVATQMRPSACTASELKALVAAHPGDEMPAMRCRRALLVDDAGCLDPERPQPRRLGLGDVERQAVGRQPDPFGVTSGWAISVMNEPSSLAKTPRPDPRRGAAACRDR